jgi:hypothetical protein
MQLAILIAKAGQLGLSYQSIARDGNCLFHCFVLNLKTHNAPEHTCETLRLKLVAWLDANGEYELLLKR